MLYLHHNIIEIHAHSFISHRHTWSVSGLHIISSRSNTYVESDTDDTSPFGRRRHTSWLSQNNPMNVVARVYTVKTSVFWGFINRVCRFGGTDNYRKLSAIPNSSGRVCLANDGRSILSCQPLEGGTCCRQQADWWSAIPDSETHLRLIQRPPLKANSDQNPVPLLASSW